MNGECSGPRKLASPAIAPAMMAMNTTTNLIMGRTPYKMQFSRTAVILLELIVPTVDTATAEHSTAYPNKHIQVLKERAAEAYKEVMVRQQGVVRQRGQGEDVATLAFLLSSKRVESTSR